ncbi:hypothetical protein [Moorena sp. SIO4G3]|nr:hypothetical protein [Moorena sp. SIO4G3]
MKRTRPAWPTANRSTPTPQGIGFIVARVCCCSTMGWELGAAT